MVVKDYRQLPKLVDGQSTIFLFGTIAATSSKDPGFQDLYILFFGKCRVPTLLVNIP